MNQATNSIQSIIETLPDGTPLELIFVQGGAEIPGFAFGKDIPDFYIGKYPITNAQYAAFLNDYGSDEVKTGEYAGEKMIREHNWSMQKKGANWSFLPEYECHPAIRVSWYGANAFCQWLSRKKGKNYCLPSEVRWEYAARGGKHSLGFEYAGSNKLKEVGWFGQNSHMETKPVGLKKANELGIFDMSGNVWEWCEDVWHDDYKGAPKDGEPWMKGGDQSLRVVRGGSWGSNGSSCRVSLRVRNLTVGRINNFGFRLARY